MNGLPTPVDAELHAAASNLNVALVKLRRLVDEGELEDEPDRLRAVRVMIPNLNNLACDLNEI